MHTTSPVAMDNETGSSSPTETSSSFRSPAGFEPLMALLPSLQQRPDRFDDPRLVGHHQLGRVAQRDIAIDARHALDRATRNAVFDQRGHHRLANAAVRAAFVEHQDRAA